MDRRRGIVTEEILILRAVLCIIEIIRVLAKTKVEEA